MYVFFRNISTISPSKIFEDCLENYVTIKGFCRINKNFPDSRLSGNFPDNVKTFQTNWKLSRLPRNVPDYPETFQTICKLFRPSVNFPDHLKTLKTIWSRNFPIQFQGLHTKTFWACKNF